MLCNRTDIHAVLITCRGNRTHYSRPHTFASSPLVEQFFQLLYDESLDDFSVRLESYALAGIEGTWDSHRLEAPY